MRGVVYRGVDVGEISPDDVLPPSFWGSFRTLSRCLESYDQPYGVSLCYSEIVSAPPQVLLPHLQLDRGSLHLCHNILSHPVPKAPSTCPADHPNFRNVRSLLLCLTQGPALAAVEEGRPLYSSRKLAFECPGVSPLAEDSCGLPLLGPGYIYPSPNCLSHLLP